MQPSAKMFDPKKRLLELQNKHEMWAFTKEAFCAVLGCTLESAGVEDPFMTASKLCFFGPPGSGHPKTNAALLEPITDDWAKSVIDRALEFLPS